MSECKNCGAPKQKTSCEYCGTEQESKPRPTQRKLIQASMTSYDTLTNVELQGNMNKVGKAVNCVISGNMNKINHAINCQITGNMNKIKHEESCSISDNGETKVIKGNTKRINIRNVSGSIKIEM